MRRAPKRYALPNDPPGITNQPHLQESCLSMADMTTSMKEEITIESRIPGVPSSVELEDAPLAFVGQEDLLLSRALEGDPRSFSTLCDRYRNRVWRIISSVARGPDVDDLAQEAIIKAFNALKSYRGEASFEAWLCRIALNVAHDYQRSAWRRRVVFWQDDPVVPEVPGESTEGMLIQREMQKRIRKAVAALPDRQRSPLWLHYFEGFTLAEIARLEDVSESTLRSRVQAGLKRLAMSLHDLPDALPGADLRLGAESKGCYL
jgi:RNA polymerase sigma-70 factor, ECF subfamily